MNQPPYELDSDSTVVLETLKEVCRHRGWNLFGAYAQQSCACIVEAEIPPEKVMNDFKAYASRALNRLGGEKGCQKRWARHGSARRLWKDQDVRDAIHYVVEEQGEPIAVFLGDVP
jgi:hypothetical protein